jgi:peptidoglycan/xylan/chitin deacetylase (PgdA/CDA1 family)
MYLNSIPAVLRFLLPSNLEWNIKTTHPEIFLTFDDGPVPEVTPWVLDQLDRFEAKATFFCVGDNVRNYPEVYRMILERGHMTGNHTYNHLKAWKTSQSEYLLNIAKCKDLVESTLFRPPHGQITPSLARMLRHDYRIIMWSILSRDFDREISPSQCLEIAIKGTNRGSVVVFHDSIKAWNNLETALPGYLEYFTQKGFRFSTL